MPKENELFRKQYRFYGRHALRVIELTKEIDSKAKLQVFQSAIDVYKAAPLVGYMYQRREPIDRTKDESGKVADKSIFPDQMFDASQALKMDLRMIMLLDKEYEPDEEKRLEKALRKLGNDEVDLERFEEYVRGGVDILYEKLIEGATTPEEYVIKMYEFMADFNNFFNREVSREDVLAATRE